MSFPSSPANGNVTTIAGKQYVYVSSKGAWVANIGSYSNDITLLGNINALQITGYWRKKRSTYVCYWMD